MSQILYIRFAELITNYHGIFSFFVETKVKSGKAMSITKKLNYPYFIKISPDELAGGL